MSIIAWVIFFAIELVFWLWILKWGGAQRLEGSFASGFLISIFASNWSAEGIKLFAWFALAVSAIWFLLGLFYPDVRFY